MNTHDNTTRENERQRKRAQNAAHILWNSESSGTLTQSSPLEANS